jgi:hypothetical protein
MPHPHDQDDELTVHDLVDDAVVPGTQPVTVVVPGEFLDVGIRAARIVLSDLRMHRHRTTDD